MSASASGAWGGRLARLEQAVSQLQAQAGGGEQLSPNYLTVDAQGRVGANFTGLINALGLIIPADETGPPVEPNLIVWTRASDGAVIARIWGSRDPGAASTDELNLEAIADAGDSAQVSVIALDTASRETGFLINNLAPASIQALAAGGLGSQSPTLITETGASNFAQLPSPARLFVDGPHQVAVPALAAGGQAGVNFNTSKPSWTTAMVLGGTAFVGAGGVVACSGGNYLGGSLWTADFFCASASGATAAQVFVLGF